MLDFRVYKFLAAVFTPELSISNPLKIANNVVDLLGEYVGIEPSILPIPKDAPSEIPRIIFSSPDKKWSLNISKERTNLYYNISPTSSEKKEEITIGEFTSVAMPFFSEYIKEINSRVQRIAFVTERSVITDDALDYVLNRFAKKEQVSKGRAFHNTKRFEIHSLKKYTWQKFNINSWVRIQFLPMKTDDGETTPGILVTNDLNTQSLNEAPEVAYDADDIAIYFNNIEEHLSEILKLYFG